MRAALRTSAPSPMRFREYPVTETYGSFVEDREKVYRHPEEHAESTSFRLPNYGRKPNFYAVIVSHMRSATAGRKKLLIH
ncbi:hypothetical protein DBV15_08487 [Temnothorax longispinosus]|uniref:Uncharacterized protein n=1 Tax=Temnothorax longispinosus TaxID=300112 RepID=A0A4S2KMN6_9HYME|nr:hypothetical protein DBV15_08487 [Temnothorax longispinosus]